MKTKHIYASLTFFAMTLGAVAQNLSTEVVVDRNVVPAEHAATRPTWLTPALVLPDSDPTILAPDIYTSLSPINRDYSVLDPAEGAYAAEKTPYRGYVAAGYFPTLDFGVSAGYRVIDTDKMRLGARLQFDSERYRPYEEADEIGVQYFATGAAGIDFEWIPMKYSKLSASAQYNYLREKTTYWYPQNINSGKISAGWNSKAGILSYHANMSLGFEKSTDTYWYLTDLGASPLCRGVSQTDTRFDVGTEILAGPGQIGVQVCGNLLHTSGIGAATLGFVDVEPFYAYVSQNFTAQVGLKLDFEKNISKNRTNVMPDIRLMWKPVKALGVWANVTGGSVTNSFSDIRQECVYQLFTRQFSCSRIPISIDGGINVGPFRGFYFGVFGGYAVADGWLMAQNSVNDPFAPVNVKGWHAGIKAGAEWKFIKGEVSADFAPSAYDKAWFWRRDRAATVIDASVVLTPLEPLAVTVGYQFRNRRKAYSSPGSYIDMVSVSDLSAGAEWRFTHAFSVFGRVENILGRRYMMVAWQPSRKVTGLFGVSYKF